MKSIRFNQDTEQKRCTVHILAALFLIIVLYSFTALISRIDNRDKIIYENIAPGTDIYCSNGYVAVVAPSNGRFKSTVHIYREKNEQMFFSYFSNEDVMNVDLRANSVIFTTDSQLLCFDYSCLDPLWVSEKISI